MMLSTRQQCTARTVMRQSGHRTELIPAVSMLSFKYVGQYNIFADCLSTVWIIMTVMISICVVRPCAEVIRCYCVCAAL